MSERFIHFCEALQVIDQTNARYDRYIPTAHYDENELPLYASKEPVPTPLQRLLGTEKDMHRFKVLTLVYEYIFKLGKYSKSNQIPLNAALRKLFDLQAQETMTIQQIAPRVFQFYH